MEYYHPYKLEADGGALTEIKKGELICREWREAFRAAVLNTSSRSVYVEGPAILHVVDVEPYQYTTTGHFEMLLMNVPVRSVIPIDMDSLILRATNEKMSGRRDASLYNLLLEGLYDEPAIGDLDGCKTIIPSLGEGVTTSTHGEVLLQQLVTGRIPTPNEIAKLHRK